MNDSCGHTVSMHGFGRDFDIPIGSKSDDGQTSSNGIGLRVERLVAYSDNASDTYLSTPDGSYLAISRMEIHDNCKKIVLVHDGARRSSRFVIDRTNLSREQLQYAVFVEIRAGYHMGTYTFCHPSPYEEDDAGVYEICGRKCVVLKPSAIHDSIIPNLCDLKVDPASANIR